MAKPVIALLLLVSIVFGVKWNGARHEVYELQARLEAAEKRAAELERRPRGANVVRSGAGGMTEEQEVALVLAAIATSAEAETEATAGAGVGANDRDLELMRKRLERAERAVDRAERARRAANGEREKLLRERQGLLEQLEVLRQDLAVAVGELVKTKATAPTSSAPSLRRF